MDTPASSATSLMEAEGVVNLISRLASTQQTKEYSKLKLMKNIEFSHPLFQDSLL